MQNLSAIAEQVVGVQQPVDDLRALLQAFAYSGGMDRRFSSISVSRMMCISAVGESSNASRPQMQVPGGQEFRMGKVAVMGTDHSHSDLVLPTTEGAFE